jgi:hypothetical protein
VEESEGERAGTHKSSSSGTFLQDFVYRSGQWTEYQSLLSQISTYVYILMGLTETQSLQGRKGFISLILKYNPEFRKNPFLNYVT